MIALDELAFSRDVHQVAGARRQREAERSARISEREEVHSRGGHLRPLTMAEPRAKDSSPPVKEAELREGERIAQALNQRRAQRQALVEQRAYRARIRDEEVAATTAEQRALGVGDLMETVRDCVCDSYEFVFAGEAATIGRAGATDTPALVKALPHGLLDAICRRIARLDPVCEVDSI
eukprot:4536837-Prymnesium_polylepis.2